MIYYPIPLHMQKAFASDRLSCGQFFLLQKNYVPSVLSLPMHTELDQETLQYICDTVLQVVN